jgi:hypothetical protein
MLLFFLSKATYEMNCTLLNEDIYRRRWIPTIGRCCGGWFPVGVVAGTLFLGRLRLVDVFTHPLHSHDWEVLRWVVSGGSSGCNTVSRKAPTVRLVDVFTHPLHSHDWEGWVLVGVVGWAKERRKMFSVVARPPSRVQPPTTFSLLSVNFSTVYLHTQKLSSPGSQKFVWLRQTSLCCFLCDDHPHSSIWISL